MKTAVACATRHDVLTVTCRLDGTNAPDLSEAIDKAGSGEFDNTRIRVQTARWYMDETFLAPAKAIARLHELKALDLTTVAFRFRAWSAGEPCDAATRIGAVCQAWDRNGALIDGEIFAALDENNLLQHCTILSHNESDGGLVYRWIGDDISRTLGADWCDKSVGARADLDDTDQRYNAWTLAHYRAVLSDCLPRREWLDATLERAPIDRRINYERGLLPARMQSGEPALICVTELKAGSCRLVA